MIGRIRTLFVLVFFILVVVPLVAGHEEAIAQEDVVDGLDYGDFLREQTLSILVIMGLISTFFLVAALIVGKSNTKKLRLMLFLGIVIPAVIGTVFLVLFTLHVNITSETGGPVHWHADFEIWRCGEKVDLVEPAGFSNRVGNPLFHEHGDDRIHVEGVVEHTHDVALDDFFDVIGGKLTQSFLSVPTAHGFVEMKNGDTCGDDIGALQVFVHSVNKNQLLQKSDWSFGQTKVSDFMDYVITPSAYVPPGDCIIVEFGPVKERTEHLCESYRTALHKGELHGG